MQNSKVINATKEIDEYECSGTGPRPPVPGRENRMSKMTETGATSTANACAAAAAASAAATTSASTMAATSAATSTTMMAPAAANYKQFATSQADEKLSEIARVKKWRDKLSYLLSDTSGVNLFQRFVEEEAGPHGPYTIDLEFYFACEGLKQHTDPKTVRQLIGAIYR